MSKVKEFYKNCIDVWPQDNRWYIYTKNQISIFVRKYTNGKNILNAGSGGSTYGLMSELYHVDIVENKIKKYNKYVVADITNLPFENEKFDCIICVGSVLNYCDIQEALKELHRVTKRGGKMILEFESSNSFEFLNTNFYGKNDIIADLEYMGEKNNQHLYSLSYFKDELNRLGIKIIEQENFHIVSSLLSIIIKNDNILGWFGYLDVIARHIPILNIHASNIMLLCKK